MTGANSDTLRVITVVGDSLMPEILPNSTAIYDPVSEISDDGLYVLDVIGLKPAAPGMGVGELLLFWATLRNK